jgi:SAM-dependent methyltransferase
MDNHLELEHIETCELCGGEDHILLFNKEGFRHVRCRACGLVFVNPRLKKHLEGQIISGTGSMGEDQLTRAQNKRIQKELNRLERHRLSNRILEIGPGRGWFLMEAAGRGWETWAVEINRDAVGHLQEQNHYRLLIESAEDFRVPEQSFDIVRIWDVIEHLRSPRRALLRIASALRPGGAVYLSTTNFASLSRLVNGPEWVYLNGSDHIFLFEPDTVSRLLSETGFTEISILTRSFNMRRKLYHPEKELPPVYRILVPMRKLIDESMRFTRYGHQMIVTARKLTWARQPAQLKKSLEFSGLGQE